MIWRSGLLVTRPRIAQSLRTRRGGSRRKAIGDGDIEALRILKRHLSDVVYRALQADAATKTINAAA